MKKKIYYHDTDCGGVVYYANYLKYMEEARTEYFEERGLSIKELAGSGTLFVVAHQEIDYKFPAVYGDVLEISTRFTEVKAVKLTVEHEVKNQEDKLICTNKTILVCVGQDIRPKAIPPEVSSKFKHESE
ncbi:MAG: YbgC/FadM family acyl-CoA thioesterase [Candidatus Omnitrophica bacterium]|nr:YbgC/FadM family acyl-CoA thioesterase [Candidatus Omnitrophota bacterium]